MEKTTSKKNNPVSEPAKPFFNSPETKEGAFFPSIQTSLALGQPDDPYEKEAEKVAQQVMQQYDTIGGGQAELSSQPLQTMLIQPMVFRRYIRRRMQRRLRKASEIVQAKCAHCEEEEKKVQPSSTVQRSGDQDIVNENIENQINHSRGRGQSMDAGTKALMEVSLGADFTGVRLHTDTKAVQMSKDLNAHAFTVGNDIYFNEGKYQPQSKEGLGLLSHELTHVVQQGAAVQTKRDTSIFQDKSLSNPVLESTIKSGVQQSSIFRKVIDRFQNDFSRSSMSQHQQLTKSKSSDTIEMIDHAKKIRRCGGCGSGCNAPMPAPAACVQPVNWKHGNARNHGTEAIRVDISWESSTGNLADLSDCTVREVVNYDPIPDPPFTGWNPANPTILTVPGVNGAAMDTHQYSPGVASITKSAGTSVAHQVYQWKCTGPGCDSQWHDFPSQNYTITRAVAGSGASWTYTITKTGGNGFSFSRSVPIP